MTIRSRTTEPIDLREEWRDMQRRIVELIRSDLKSDLGDQLLELDPQIYTDQKRFEAERRTVFMEEPMLVALSNELADRIGIPLP
jgi:hypothetical protein